MDLGETALVLFAVLKVESDFTLRSSLKKMTSSRILKKILPLDLNVIKIHFSWKIVQAFSIMTSTGQLVEE